MKFFFNNLISFICAAVFILGCNNNIEPAADEGDQLNISNADSLSLASLVKINDSPFYTMTHYGDYGFAARVGKDNGNAQSSSQHTTLRDGWGCTCVTALSGDEVILGRNFDWDSSVPLLLYTDPPVGYASVSMVDLEFLGYDRSNLPDNWNNRLALLNAPWWPFDGMNEMGVAIGMMAIPNADSPFDPSKTTIGEIDAIRLVLDFAASTEEAIQLLGEYNIRMETPPIHYLISDRSGSSAIVEFVDDEMIVIRNNEGWQVSTNFIIYGSGAPANSVCWRYNTSYNRLSAADGIMTASDVMNLLQSVSSSTKWSVIYNLETGEIRISTNMRYDRIVTFNINELGK